MPLSAIALPILLSVLKVASVAALGFFLAKRALLHDSATADLSELVVKVTVPCLVFANAAGGIQGITPVTATALVAAGPAILGVGYISSVALAKILGVRPADRKAVVAASTFQNSAYLPLSVGTSVIGLIAPILGFAGTAAQAVGATVLSISVFGVAYSPLFWGIGLSWLTEAKNGETQRLTVGRLLPAPVIGLIAGYTVGFTPIHLILTPPGAPLHFLFEAAGDVGGLTVPLANLVLGAMLARAGSGIKEPFKNYAIVAATRFGIAPALCLWLLWITRGLWLKDAGFPIAASVIFLESVTPPATNLAVMSRRASAGIDDEGQNTSNTAEAIPRILLVTYLLSTLLMPAWLIVFLHVVGRH